MDNMTIHMARPQGSDAGLLGLQFFLCKPIPWAPGMPRYSEWLIVDFLSIFMKSLKIHTCMQCALITVTPHSSHLPPTQPHLTSCPFSVYTLLGPSSVTIHAWRCTTRWRAADPGTTHSDALSQRNHQLPTAPQLEVGAHEPPRLRGGTFTGLSMSRSFLYRQAQL